MPTLSNYCNLVKLRANGSRSMEELPAARAFLQQQFPQIQESTVLDHAAIQRHLSQQMHNAIPGGDRSAAELCLRCFISHQIEQVCIQLETQFGAYYGFTRQELFALVLDDDGRELSAGSFQPEAFSPSSISDRAIQPTNSQQPFLNAQQDYIANSQQPIAKIYQPLAAQILQKFDPDRASLTAWTTRLVKQNPQLNAFLLERGLCMLSDWAILNDTRDKKLRQVLSQFHHLTQAEVEQASQLLQSYHAVYRRDRLLQGQKGQCQAPSPAQLQEICQLWQSHPPQPSPASVLARLQELADRLRQHRISARGGSPPTQSLDDPNHQPLSENLSANSEDPNENAQNQFLQTYRQQFLTCLGNALAQGVSDRLQTLKPPKQQLFLQALKLFHCEGLSMTEIAQKVGLQAQFQVSRLLNLKPLRADVRHGMLACLRSAVRTNALNYVAPDELDRLDSQIETALGEQIDTLLQADQANSKTPKSYVAGSVFSRHLCRYLETVKK